MKKTILIIVVFLVCFGTINSQNTLTGIIIDAHSKIGLENVVIRINSSDTTYFTDINGVFSIKENIKDDFILSISLQGYESQKYPIEYTNEMIDLGEILLYKDIFLEEDISVITLTDDELHTDTDAADNIAGLLQASRDVFLRTVAFEFSASFFKIRGLDASNSKLLINGIEMNRVFDGRAQWSNWGGLNDVLRNQEFSTSLSASNYTFGGILGATNINTRASEQRAGTRVSYASSNRSYVHRAMGTYSTGMLKNNWAFTFSGSRRAGIEGFNEGTSYNAYSLFASVEKKINDAHSFNFTSIFAPNRRGKSSANTQEVFDLKGISYNEYWGYLNGNKTNSRIKEVVEPIFMLNHYWDINTKFNLQTNISYQLGKIGNSRLDFNGGANPSATYWQLLPSFFLINNNFEDAYKSQQHFETNGQLDWLRIFDANSTNASLGLENSYVLYEDRTDDTLIHANTILTATINEHVRVNGKLTYRNFNSNAFAEVIDLLGGNAYLDINNFADTEKQQQNNLLTPNRLVGVGDKFRYHYNLKSTIANGFVQGQFTYNKIDFYTAASLATISYQREGFYKNGRFENNSLGKSDRVNFVNYGLKSGFTYKITGRHFIDFNTGFLTKAPTLRNTFSNARENNAVVDGIENEKQFSADVSYILRSPKITSRLTSYYTGIQDATEVSFFFADGIGGDTTAFVQENLSNIEKRHFGLEFGIEIQIMPTLKLKGAASVGQFTYNNNPNLYLTSDEVNEGVFNAEGRSKNYITNLKNYKLASGPQNAFSVGFEYRDPNYWWFGATSNFFSNIYVDVSPLPRSANFYEDSDGLPFFNLDTALANKLLAQEKFDSYMTVNLVGGKSWKLQDTYISVFASVNNLLNTIYRTGGFEQGRNANYTQLKEDTSLEIPVFGNKYWYGRGTTYFLNISYSF